MEEDTSNDYLHVNIDLPTFKLEVKTDKPSTALVELRKILESLNLDEEMVYEEFVTEELRTVFSESFINNNSVMSSIKRLLKQEDDYRIAKAEIPCNATIDLDSKTKSVEVSRTDIQHGVSKLTLDIDARFVKQGIVHINGDVGKEGRLLIVDHIHKFMPTAQLRAFHSKNKNGLAVECIFFGDFPDEEYE